MNEEHKILTKDSEAFLKYEFQFFKWMYDDNYESFALEMHEDLRICDSCDNYFWADCKKMCDCQ